MKKLLSIFSFIVFSQSGFAEEHPNSWKMNIQCKDGGNKWYEAHFVVDVVDDKFTLNFDKRWSWMKNISFEGIINNEHIGGYHELEKWLAFNAPDENF